MSQQIFDKHWPLAKNGANELIPGAAILQTRDDKDEPITLAAAVQWDESSGLFLPTHKENPLEVRVRELEAKLDELKQTIESGVQLKGQIVDTLCDVTVDVADFGNNSYNRYMLWPNGSVSWSTSRDAKYDITEYSELLIKIVNNTDVNCGFSISTNSGLFLSLVRESGTSTGDVSRGLEQVPSGATALYHKETVPVLGDVAGFRSMHLVAQLIGVSSGSLRWVVQGVRAIVG